MADFVTKESFNELKGDVRTIGNKVDALSERIVKVECAIANVPDKTVAQIVEKIYNFPASYDDKNKDDDKISKTSLIFDGAKWVITIIMCVVLGAVLKTVIPI